MIRVVIDSSCDLLDEFIREKKIEVVPLYLKIKDKFLRDRIDITSKESFEFMRKGQKMSTSQPTVSDFTKVYRKIISQGDEIITVLITGKGSGTVNVARLAREEVNKEKISIVDSTQISGGIGFVVKRIIHLIEEGFSRERIMSLFNRIISNIHLFIALDTIKFTYTGGRVNDIKDFATSVLNLKPILVMREGLPRLLRVVRGRKKSLKLIANLILNKIREEPKKRFELAFLHADSYKDILKVREEILSNVKPDFEFTKIIGSALGVHAGPGAIGVCIHFKEEEL